MSVCVTLHADAQGYASCCGAPPCTELMRPTGSLDKSAKVWDAQSGAELHHLQEHSYQVTAVAFGSGSDVITASADGSGPCSCEAHDCLTQVSLARSCHTLKS